MSFNSHTILAVIPARGGSKRLPNKNILPLGDKPLIAWTICAASKSKYIDRICVSTDDPSIAEIASEHHAEVPFLRPAEISTDQSTSLAVVQHALEHYRKNESIAFEFALLLQPTSPLRTAEDIDNAVSLLFGRNMDNVVSVCKSNHPPQWTIRLPSNQSLRKLAKSLRRKYSPSMGSKYYRLNGALYLCRVSTLSRESSLIFLRNSIAYVMPREASVDIDTMTDFEYAEFLVERNRYSKERNPV